MLVVIEQSKMDNNNNETRRPSCKREHDNCREGSKETMEAVTLITVTCLPEKWSLEWYQNWGNKETKTRQRL